MGKEKKEEKYSNYLFFYGFGKLLYLCILYVLVPYMIGAGKRNGFIHIKSRHNVHLFENSEPLVRAHSIRLWN